MDRYQIACALEKFASDAGFEPAQPFYITEQFRVEPANGVVFYSDESYLYCETCARDYLEKAFPFLSDDGKLDHEVYMADSTSPEDTTSACDTCRKTLRHCLSDTTGVGEELAHYADNPIEPGEIISPDTAYCIAQIVASAYGDDIQEAIALGESALAAIEAKRASEAAKLSEGALA